MGDRVYATFATISAAILSLMGGLSPPPTPSPEGAAPVDSPPSIAASAQLESVYGRLPLSFEPNQGQADPSVGFLARASGYTVALMPDEVRLTPHPETERGSLSRTPPAPIARAELSGVDLPAEEPVAVRFVGADANAPASPEGRLPGTASYFIGNDPARWRAGIPTYASVRYHDVYPGIDLVFHGHGRELEYDFVVAPGADPSLIRLEVVGTDAAALDDQGDLVLRAGAGELRQRKSVVYQEPDGRRQQIDARYLLETLGGAQPSISPLLPVQVGPGGAVPVAFAVNLALGAYDPRLPLVIDPVLAFTKQIGGSGDELATGVVTDVGGNAFITGQTTSVSGGGIHGFVTKVDIHGGTVAYTVAFGGSGVDAPNGIGIDSARNAYMVGATTSSDFPTQNPAQAVLGGSNVSNGFVLKISPDAATLLYSTYLGGSGGDGGAAIAVDPAGNAYVAGSALSTNFPVTRPLQGSARGGYEAFVAKLSPAGALVYSTYLGGTANDAAAGVAIDPAGNAYVIGTTLSSDFPVAAPLQSARAGAEDAFIAKLNPQGSALVYSTYLGGANADAGFGIALDATGSAYVTGTTESNDFPTRSGYQTGRAGNHDAFVAKLSPAGSSLVYSTYLGGGDDDAGVAIAVDQANTAYVVGQTASTNFPVRFAPELSCSSCTSGASAAFLSRVNSVGDSLIISGYINGAIAGGVAVDSSGDVVFAGATRSQFNQSLDALVNRYHEDRTFADLSVTLDASPDPVIVGSSVTYTGTVSNAGPATTTFVTADILVRGTTATSSVTTNQGTCPHLNSPGSSVNHFSCTLGDLAGGASVGISISVRPGADAAGGAVEVTMSASGSGFDPTPANTATRSVHVVGPTPTPTPPPSCAPRPNVQVQSTALGDGRLQVTLTAQGARNTLQRLRFGEPRASVNDLIDVGGQSGRSGQFAVTLPGATQQTTFYVRHAAAGQATTVQLVVTDGCGDWPTFVGGGAGGF
ncbi:MAG TPA: SBBP repeat-containing protein [Chloroflexota bacterium]|jgi:hypothetical protein